MYWELMPPAVSTSLTTKLVSDLSRDAASAQVRASVLKGLAYLLDNHLALVSGTCKVFEKLTAFLFHSFFFSPFSLSFLGVHV